MRGKGRAQRGLNRSNVATRQQIQSLRREMLGHKIVPSANPPVFIERPWNQYTFQRTDINESDFQAFTITVNDIINQIRGRLNINSVGPGDVGNNISIKIQDARVWCTASSLILPDLECSFYELRPGGAQSVRYTQRDVGTLNMPAKVGYAFPTIDTKEVLDVNDVNVQIMTSTATQTGSQVTQRVHLLWKSSA